MPTDPHLTYKYTYKLSNIIEQLYKGNPLWHQQDLLEGNKIKWCQQNLDPRDWDLDYINLALIFANQEILTQFCLVWD